jgi:hypothetical protein
LTATGQLVRVSVHEGHRRQPPEPPFEHLLRLSDTTGVFEHARGALPRREHGYCVDDVGRALLVLAREPDPSAELRTLTERCLSFLAHSQGPGGAFRNRMGYDRQWRGGVGTGDWWGRAMWGLGAAAAHGHQAWLREQASACFELGARQRSRSPRAMAYAALGAAEILAVRPDHEAARALLGDAATVVRRCGDDPAWPWPEERLAYANALLPDALIAAGQHLDDDVLTEHGLRLLEWLLETETHDGHLSVTATGGWAPGIPRPAFDQQPIEAATLVEACVRALAVTGAQGWMHGARRGIAWFLGDNDLGTPMMDATTGGCSDGLGATGPSANQGAESTLALLATLQHARRFRRTDHDQ